MARNTHLGVWNWGKVSSIYPNNCLFNGKTYNIPCGNSIEHGHVDSPIKLVFFSMAMLVYQKVFHGNSGCTILRQTHFRTMSLRTCCVAHWDLELAVEVRQCTQRSGACGWGPGSAHWDLERAVEVRQCPLIRNIPELAVEIRGCRRRRRRGRRRHSAFW